MKYCICTIKLEVQRLVKVLELTFIALLYCTEIGRELYFERETVSNFILFHH